MEHPQQQGISQVGAVDSIDAEAFAPPHFPDLDQTNIDKPGGGPAFSPVNSTDFVNVAQEPLAAPMFSEDSHLPVEPPAFSLDAMMPGEQPAFSDGQVSTPPLTNNQDVQNALEPIGDLAPPPFGGINPNFAQEVSEFANTGESLVLSYNLTIEEIDTAQAKAEVESVLKISRLALDVDLVAQGVKSGRVELEKLNPAVAFLILQYLKPLGLKFRLQQNTLS